MRCLIYADLWQYGFNASYTLSWISLWSRNPNTASGPIMTELASMLHMMFKLGQCAEKNWRRLRGFNYLAKVITGVKFKDGIEVIDVDQVAA
jgi:hypothetical protein